MNPQLDLSKPVQFRNGEPARIISTNGRRSWEQTRFPIISEDQNGVLRCHTVTGSLEIHDAPRQHDLVNVRSIKETLSGWLNVYADGGHRFYITKSLADKYAAPTRTACLDLSKYNIEFEEGEGLP